MSMGSLLLAAGAKGKRYILPNATVMIHQPSGGYSGVAEDIAIHAKEVTPLLSPSHPITSHAIQALLLCPTPSCVRLGIVLS